MIDGYTLVPNPFWGGVLFPTVVFGFVILWPWIERRLVGDDAFHNILDRPRDAPLRTAVGVGVVSWVFIVFVAGSSDRADVLFGLSYTAQIWFYRVASFVLPVVAAVVAYRMCGALVAGEWLEEDQKRAEAEARLVHMRRSDALTKS